MWSEINHMEHIEFYFNYKYDGGTYSSFIHN